jgi:hypothetical protein
LYLYELPMINRKFTGIPSAEAIHSPKSTIS